MGRACGSRSHVLPAHLLCQLFAAHNRHYAMLLPCICVLSCSQFLRPSTTLINILFDHSVISSAPSDILQLSTLLCLSSSHSSNCSLSSMVQWFLLFVLVARFALNPSKYWILDLRLLRQTSIFSSSCVFSGSCSRHLGLNDPLISV